MSPNWQEFCRLVHDLWHRRASRSRDRRHAFFSACAFFLQVQPTCSLLRCSKAQDFDAAAIPPSASPSCARPTKTWIDSSRPGSRHPLRAIMAGLPPAEAASPKNDSVGRSLPMDRRCFRTAYASSLPTRGRAHIDSWATLTRSSGRTAYIECTPALLRRLEPLLFLTIDHHTAL